MALQLEQVSPTKIWVHDGTTNVAEFDSTAGVKIGTLTVGTGNDTVLTSTAKELNTLDGIASSVTVALAAATGANNIRITITATDAAGAAVAAAHQLEFWMSEDAAGIGLTGDAYSGDLVAITGEILSAHTAKKHWSVATAATGIFVADLEDTGVPADQYAAVKKPLGAAIVVSAVSGSGWGA